MYPILNANYTLLKQFGESIIYPIAFGSSSQYTSGVYKFEKINSTAAEILELSSGELTIIEIAEILAERHNEDVSVSCEIVEAFIEECVRKDIIMLASTETYTEIDVSGSFETIYPFNVQFELTKMCPLRCLHCYNRSGVKGNNELSTSEVKLVLDKIKNMGVKKIQFTGGEPTTRSDLTEIIRYAADGMLSILLTSNGYEFSPELVDAIKKCENVIVQISIDGLEDNHNRIRGTLDSFRRAINSIEYLASQGIIVIVSYTINSINFSDIEPVTELAKKLGAKQITYSGTLISGRALDNNISNTFVHEGIELEVYLTKLGKKYKSNNFFVAFGEGIEIESNTTCGKAISQLCIRENGDVSPCVLYDFTYGNLLEQEPEELFHYSKIQKLITPKIPDKDTCIQCAKYTKCHGCEAVAYGIPAEMCRWKKENIAYFDGLRSISRNRR